MKSLCHQSHRETFAKVLFVDASGAAGALWDVCEEKRPRGVDGRSDSKSDGRPISVTDAGFKGSRDATIGMAAKIPNNFL